VIRNLISLSKIACSCCPRATERDEVGSVDEAASNEMEAETIGCSRYSLSNITLIACSPCLISAKPAVSVVKYGLPKNIVSLWNEIRSLIEFILSTLRPPLATSGTFKLRVPWLFSRAGKLTAEVDDWMVIISFSSEDIWLSKLAVVLERASVVLDKDSIEPESPATVPERLETVLESPETLLAISPSDGL
jgi:hypothetical protein